MTKLYHEIFINAAPEKVWAVLADLEAVQSYNPLVTKANITSQTPYGIGASRHCEFTPNGFSNERVTDWDEGSLIGLDTVESSFPMKICRWKTQLTPKNGGTLVSQNLEYVVKFGILGDLMNILVMKRKYNQILGNIFVGLKKFVESQ
ncbi:MAG: SRPBCC family protein [Saprospiraceae bacterium]|nr:SRPBCC family protein [Saprospiraceae bacterium]